MQNFWRRIAGYFHGAACHRSKLAAQHWAAKPAVMAVTVSLEGQIRPVVSTLSLEDQRSTSPHWRAQGMVDILHGLTKKQKGTTCPPRDFSKTPIFRWNFKRCAGWETQRGKRVSFKECFIVFSLLEIDKLWVSLQKSSYQQGLWFNVLTCTFLHHHGQWLSFWCLLC